MSGADEFDEIARLFRPLTGGAPGAFGLLDDAAVIEPRPGHDLVVTKDALVEGVHFPPGDPPDLIARKLLRVNLSDLAAKAAEPFAAFLAVAWPRSWDAVARTAFADGLGRDLRTYGVALMGGDTVSTPGPFTASLTLMGWAPHGGMIRRGGGQAGDVIAVSGTIGDGTLGLSAARGELADPQGLLVDRFRLPRPRLELCEALRTHAAAAADVSDGLVADGGHIAKASRTGLVLNLERVPLSAAAAAWLAAQPDRGPALVRLATGGDDYEVVAAFRGEIPSGFTPIGALVAGAEVTVRLDGRIIDTGAGGWRHN